MKGSLKNLKFHPKLMGGGFIALAITCAIFSIIFITNTSEVEEAKTSGFAEVCTIQDDPNTTNVDESRAGNALCDGLVYKSDIPTTMQAMTNSICANKMSVYQSNNTGANYVSNNPNENKAGQHTWVLSDIRIRKIIKFVNYQIIIAG
jgi:hypothetical protein